MKTLFFTFFYEKQKFQDPNRPNSRPCLYYYWDRQHFFFSTLYRVHRFQNQLNKMSKRSMTKEVLHVCPNHLDKKYEFNFFFLTF